MKNSKNATTQIGVAIIVMALLLLIGGVFLDDSNNSKYINSKEQNNYQENNAGSGSLQNSNFIFYLNNTNLGKQQRVIENYPNIILGSKLEFNDIYLGNNFKLIANPFNNNLYPIEFQSNDISNVNNFLIYFNTVESSGNEILNIYFNEKLIVQNKLKNLNLPIKISNFNYNTVSSDEKEILSIIKEDPFISILNIAQKLNYSEKRVVVNLIKLENISIIKRKKYEDYFYFDIIEEKPTQKITFEILKPKIYDIFNWNSFEIKELRIVEEIQNKKNNERKFNFQIKKDFLEAVYVNLAISCEEIKEVSEAIEIKVNGFIISNENPSCNSNYNRITTSIPLNILSNKKNTLELNTNGFYKVAYSITKNYFNDEDVYKFNINNFNDIRDVVIYGDFDKEVIDLRLNSQTFTLGRNEIKSIVGNLRFGINELKILTKPIEIKELIIEKNDFYN